MGLGILESRGTLTGHHVPGTILLDTHNASEIEIIELEAAGLKKGSGKNSEIILVPQPSNDPNDPLNWPIWQRDLILLLYCYGTVCCIGGIGPILSPMAIPFIMEWGISFTQFSQLTGYQFCTVGAVGIFVSACARKFGKRPTLLWSISFVFAGTVWGGFAQSYQSLLGARVVQGLGMAMFESVTFSIIGDLYHVHQRGTRMTAYIVAQTGLSQLPVTVAGKLTMDLSWRWVFYLLSIFVGISWVLCIFFGWETVYNRGAVYNLDTSSRDRVDKIMEHNDATSINEVENTNQSPAEMTVIQSNSEPPRRETYLQRLKPFHGTFTPQPLWRMIIRPIVVLINPIVIWSILIIAFTTAWAIVISYTIAQAFSGPPYSLDVAQQGYISAGPLVGGLIGCLLCGLICDPLARFFTRKNGGIYEPEFRLPMMIAVPIVSTLGYFLFGNLIQQGQTPIAASVMFGVVYVSVQFATVSTGAYIVDAFRDISVDIFIISMTVKNFIFFGFTLFLNDWFASWGPAKMFNTIGGIQLALSLTTIPVYIYGKRIRAWWHTHMSILNQARVERLTSAKVTFVREDNKIWFGH